MITQLDTLKNIYEDIYYNTTHAKTNAIASYKKNIEKENNTMVEYYKIEKAIANVTSRRFLTRAINRDLLMWYRSLRPGYERALWRSCGRQIATMTEHDVKPPSGGPV